MMRGIQAIPITAAKAVVARVRQTRPKSKESGGTAISRARARRLKLAVRRTE
jgi:hypothetical protein